MKIHPIAFLLIILLTTFLMGSSFAVGKIGLHYSSPLFLVSLRFLIAGGLMTLIVSLRGLPVPKRSIDWGKIATIGTLQTTGVMACTFLSLRTITAGESSILIFTNPLLVIVFGSLLLRARYRWTQWLGVVLGVLGVAITMGLHMQLKSGTILGVIGACSWAIATLLMKRWSGICNVWVLTAYQMLCGGILLLLLSIVLEQPHFEWNLISTGILLWLAIMASIVQFAGWFYVLGKGDAAQTSAFLFLAPFFGVLSGWLLLGEQVQWYVYIGGVFVFLGIFLVNWNFNKPKKEADPI